MFHGSKQLEAFLFGNSPPFVLYGCECKRTYPIHTLLYCQQCQKVKCPFCIKEEIDSHYCPNCLDNMTSYDALLFKNRCKKCFECPSCSASLSFIQSAGKTEEATSEEQGRAVYLHCTFCRWDSLALGLQADTPNTLLANYIRRERADPQQIEVNALVEEYQRLARETRLRVRSKRFAGAPLTETAALPLTPITVGEVEEKLQAKNEKLTMKGLRKERSALNEAEKIEKEKSREEQDSSPKKECINIHEIATLEQRFFDLAHQPSKVCDIWPRRRQLLTRHSKWCRGCEKLLIKPDLIASKIEFKRQHVALSYIPKITVAPYPLPIPSQEPLILTLVITNPVTTLMHITANEHQSPEHTTATIQPSSITTFIGVSDEYDDLWETEEYRNLKAEEESSEKSKIVIARHLNKVHLLFNIQPLPDASVVKFALLVKVRYNTTTGGPQEVEVPVHINLGPLAVRLGE